MKGRYYPSQQELVDPAKLERVLRDTYDRIYKLNAPAKPTAPVAPVIVSVPRSTGSSGESPSSVPVPSDLALNSLTVATTTVTGQFSLSTGVWDDTQQSAIALRDTGANIPTIEQVGSTSWWLPNFDSVGDKLIFSHQFTHGLMEEAIVEVHPHVHWLASSDSVNVVRWQLSYQWVNNEDLIGSDTTLTVDCTPYANKLQITALGAQTKAGAHISSIFAGTLTRVTNGGTDYNGEVYLSFFDIHFKVDTLGSDAEGSKSYPT
jgi:hypothetical protein